MAPSGMHDIGEHQRVGVQCAENCGASMVVTSPMRYLWSGPECGDSTITATQIKIKILMTRLRDRRATMHNLTIAAR